MLYPILESAYKYQWRHLYCSVISDNSSITLYLILFVSLKIIITNFILKADQWATYFDEPPFEDELEDEFESEEDLDDETYSRKGNKRKKAAAGRKPKVSFFCNLYHLLTCKVLALLQSTLDLWLIFV